MAGEILLLMVFLDKFWFGPVGKVLDERDALLRSQLGQVKGGSEELDKLTTDAEALIKAARVEVGRSQPAAASGACRRSRQWWQCGASQMEALYVHWMPWGATACMPPIAHVSAVSGAWQRGERGASSVRQRSPPPSGASSRLAAQPCTVACSDEQKCTPHAASCNRQPPGLLTVGANHSRLQRSTRLPPFSIAADPSVPLCTCQLAAARCCGATTCAAGVCPDQLPEAGQAG
jgi:hypothetical protein